MNVLLINPPSFNEIMGNNPKIIESERGYNPPLGLLLIAGYIREHSQHKVTVFDAQVEQWSYSELEIQVNNISFDVVGITTMTFTIIDVMKTVSIIKKQKPSAKVVLGGPHVGIYPEETLGLEGVDYLVLGEGEEAFTSLINHLERKKKLDDIPGLVYKKDGNIVNNGFAPVVQDLDTLAFPARDLTPYSKYSSLLAKRLPITTMFTSRGCPFQCTFCDRPALGKKFRAMSAERVVEEIEECLKLGIHEFLIYDDTFTVNKARVHKICELIINKRLDIGFDIRARIDTLDEELLVALHRAGCRGIHYGIEAGTERVLKILKKGISLDQAKEIFNLTRKFKMQVLAYFMIGNPTETVSDIETTFKIAKWLNPDFIHLTILTPFPATPLYQEGLEKGIVKKDYWREFAANPNADFIPPFWDENLTKEELDSLLVKGYKQFYARPSYIFRKLLAIGSIGEFKRKIKAGIKVLLMQNP